MATTQTQDRVEQPRPTPQRPLRYPLLAPHTPVLRRGDAEVQVGLHGDRALILTGVSPQLGQLLARLDGCHRSGDIVATGTRMGISTAEVGWVLQTLQEAGLLTEGGRLGAASNQHRLAGQHVRLVGVGPLARAVGELLLQSGIEQLTLVATARETSRARQLHETFSSLRPARVRVVSRWSGAAPAPGEVAVLAGEEAEPDRGLIEELMREDQPHLLIRPQGDSATVGPLVLPGRTSCVRCADLTRQAADPAWPMLLSQLCNTRLPCSPLLTNWAAAVGAAQVISFLTGSQPDTWSATLELGSPDFAIRWRPWASHPGCGCSWSG